MKNFHVYLHPARGYEAVKEGLSFPALFLNVFWLLFHGLIGPAVVMILCGALLFGAEISAGRNAVNDLQAFVFRLVMTGGVLTVWLLPFFHGNEWRHASLLRRGFSHLNRVSALTPDDAIARMLSDPNDGREAATTKVVRRAPESVAERAAVAEEPVGTQPA